MWSWIGWYRSLTLSFISPSRQMYFAIQKTRLSQMGKGTSMPGEFTKGENQPRGNQALHRARLAGCLIKLLAFLRIPCLRDAAPLRQIIGACILSGSVLLAVGCAMKGSATGSSNTPQATFSPSSVDFGNQDIGTTSNPLSVTLTNTGNADLVVSSMSSSPSQFAVAGQTSVTISPGKQAAYAITFSPTAAQPYAGTLAFTMNTGAPAVSLAGTGMPPTGTPPQASISPASLNFGNQLINTPSASQLVTVTNTGGGNLVINSVTSSPSQFAFVGPSSTTVAPGGHATYNVTFTPTALQLFSGSMVFDTNASPATANVSESGTGVTGTPGTICGKLDDGLVHLPPNYSCSSPPCTANPFPPPAKSAGYVDPQYGCSLTRLTDAVGDRLGSAAHHEYGTITPINADDTRVMVLLENGSFEIVDPSGAVTVPVANMPGTNSGNTPWDISIPTRFYYTTGTTIRRGDIAGLPGCASTHSCTVTSTMLHDFAGTYSSVLIPDEEDISDDGDHLWLIGDTKTFLYTISSNAVGPAMNVGTKDSATGWHKIQIMPSNRMLMTWSPNGHGPGAGQEVYNTDTTLNWHMFDNTLHTDCGRDLSNNEVCVVARIPDTGGGITGAGACPTWTGTQDGGIDVINMSSHGAQCLVDVNWADTEVSFRDGNSGGGWVFITFFNSATCNTYSCFDTTSPSRLDPSWASHWVHFAEEGILVRIDNNNSGLNSYRLFHTRSRSSEYYWAIPRGAISRDGKYVLFDSNFDISNTGLPNYTDVYVTKTH